MYYIVLAFVRNFEDGLYTSQILSESSPQWQQVPAEAAQPLLAGACFSLDHTFQLFAATKHRWQASVFPEQV